MLTLAPKQLTQKFVEDVTFNIIWMCCGGPKAFRYFQPLTDRDKLVVINQFYTLLRGL